MKEATTMAQMSFDGAVLSSPPSFWFPSLSRQVFASRMGARDPWTCLRKRIIPSPPSLGPCKPPLIKQIRLLLLFCLTIFDEGETRLFSLQQLVRGRAFGFPQA